MDPRINTMTTSETKEDQQVRDMLSLITNIGAKIEQQMNAFDDYTYDNMRRTEVKAAYAAEEASKRNPSEALPPSIDERILLEAELYADKRDDNRVSAPPPAANIEQDIMQLTNDITTADDTREITLALMTNMQDRRRRYPTWEGHQPQKLHLLKLALTNNILRLEEQSDEGHRTDQIKKYIQDPLENYLLYSKDTKELVAALEAANWPNHSDQKQALHHMISEKKILKLII